MKDMRAVQSRPESRRTCESQWCAYAIPRREDAADKRLTNAQRVAQPKALDRFVAQDSLAQVMETATELLVHDLQKR
jgi:hypothetical protein